MRIFIRNNKTNINSKINIIALAHNLLIKTINLFNALGYGDKLYLDAGSIFIFTGPTYRNIRGNLHVSESG